MSWLVILFVAIVAPELVSRDMRAGVLPLYFSRPLRAADYVGAKFVALVTAVWLLLGVPQLVMFLGAAFTTKTGMSGVWDEVGDLLPAWAYSLLWAVLFAGDRPADRLADRQARVRRRRHRRGVPDDHADRRGAARSCRRGPRSELAGLASPMTLVSGVGVVADPGGRTPA